MQLYNVKNTRYKNNTLILVIIVTIIICLQNSDSESVNTIQKCTKLSVEHVKKVNCSNKVQLTTAQCPYRKNINTDTNNVSRREGFVV